MTMVITPNQQEIIDKVKAAAGITGDINVSTFKLLDALLPKFEQFLDGDATAVATKVNNLTMGNNNINSENVRNVVAEIELEKLGTGQAAVNLLNGSVINKIDAFFQSIPEVMDLMIKNRAMIAAAFLLTLAESKK